MLCILRKYLQMIPMDNEPNVCACTFSDCCKGHIPRCLAALQAWCPVACSEVVDLKCLWSYATMCFD